jgi:uncharacterized lipoprotein YddW (UPF0748 family)
MTSLRGLLLLTLLPALLACGATQTTPPPQSAPSPVLGSTATLPENARILWYDATANFERLGTYEGIDEIVARTAAAGFTDVILDVKPLSGEVLYESRYAPRLETLDGFTRPADFDFVGRTIRRAREHGLRIHLNANIFSAGHHWHDTGPIFTTNPEWQTIILDENNELTPTTEIRRSYASFTNPARPDVREHQLNVLRELAEFRPDGVILDRGRYDELYSDFSPESRAMFEQWLGREVQNWPADIMVRTADPSTPVRGPLFKPWLEWRASVIHSFVEEAREVVKAVDPGILFGSYVGAWYPVYFDVGVNWASREYDPSQDYDWATPTYKNYGYAELVDFLMTGNYFVEVTPEDLRETNERIRLESGALQERDSTFTVESSIRLVDRIVGDATVVLPSLYVEQYHLAGRPERFEPALRTALAMKPGIMLFDLVHLEMHDLWDVVIQAFRDYPG